MAENERSFEEWLERRQYVVYVCAVCASSNIMSNEDDSYCNDCKNWMSCEELVVVPEARVPGA